MMRLIVAVGILVGSFVTQAAAQQRTSAPPPAAQQAVPGAGQNTTLPPEAQKYPGKRALTAEEFQKLVKEGGTKIPVKIGPRVSNPRAAQLDSAIIAVLQQQKIAAETTKSKILATNTLVRKESPAPLGKTQPSTVQSSGSTLNSHAMLPNQVLVNICDVQNKTVGVQEVNGFRGTLHGLTFTPDPQFNLYTVTGCNFGAANNSNKAWIFGSDGFREDFQIQYWSDTQIILNFDPATSGVLDQNSVSFVVQRADGNNQKIDNLKFYAVRGVPQQLASVEQESIHLDAVTSGFKSIASFSYTPVLSSMPVPQEALGNTVFVHRFATEKYAPGTDYFGFNQLKTGWRTDSFQVSTFDASCPWIVTYKQEFGATTAQFYEGDNIQVNWSDISCSGFAPPPCGFVGCYYSNNTSQSYALKIWLKGPRCTNPYNGQPDQACIQRIKQGQSQ